MYITQIATTVHMQIDKLYLAFFTGLAAAGFYNIASDTAWKIRTIPEMLLSPIMAAASELDAQGAQEKLRGALLPLPQIHGSVRRSCGGLCRNVLQATGTTLAGAETGPWSPTPWQFWRQLISLTSPVVLAI